MRSPRVIAVVLLKDNIVVQSYKFEKYFHIGKLSQSIKYLHDWGIDEIIILNIDKNKEINFKLLKNIIRKFNLPICYGGGVTSLKQIRKLLDIGIDKVSFNSLLINGKNKINKFANYLGNQFVVGSIDFKLVNNNYFIYDHVNKKIIKKDILRTIIEYENLGVGEFHFNFVNLDGVGKGMEIDFVKKIANEIKTPLIVSGGASNCNHLIDFYRKTKCTPCLSNFFNHIENPVSTIKSGYYNSFKEVRNDRYYPYDNYKFDIHLKRNINK